MLNRPRKTILEGFSRDMNWNDTKCEGEEEQERIAEMLSDKYIKEILGSAHLAKSQYPGTMIFYQITCGGCNIRLTDDAPMSLAVAYKCIECKHITKTVDGNLGYLDVLVPASLQNKFLEGFNSTAE